MNEKYPMLDEALAMIEEKKMMAAIDPTLTLAASPQECDSKDIFLRTKRGVSNILNYIVGLHSNGVIMPYEYTKTALDGTKTLVSTNFMPIESWGNEYDENYRLLDKSSFRVDNDIEAVAKEMEAEGWERYEGPKKVL
jgi:hypothetical protein